MAGCKVNQLSLDDACAPLMAFEQTRKLVESDEAFAIAGILGALSNVATQKYRKRQESPESDSDVGRRAIERFNVISLDHSFLSDLYRAEFGFLNVNFEGEAAGQNGRAVFERRLGQGTPALTREGVWRQGQLNDRRGDQLRSVGALY